MPNNKNAFNGLIFMRLPVKCGYVHKMLRIKIRYLHIYAQSYSRDQAQIASSVLFWFLSIVCEGL